MTESNQRKSGAVLSYISITASTLVQLLYTPFLIKMLGQSEYGLYSLIASIIGYLTVLDLGFGNAIVVYTAKYRAQGKFEEEKKLHGMFKIIFYVIGTFAFLLGIILYFNVDVLFSSTMTNEELEKAKIMMMILSFNLFITLSFNIYQSIITAYERFVFQKIMAILNTILKPLLMIPLLFMGYKSISMTIIITIVNIIVLLSNYFYCKYKLNIKIKYLGFDKKIFKVIFSYSFFIFLGLVVDKVNWSADQFILGAVSGTVAVSIYSVASQLNNLFVNLSTAISSVMLPKMSKMIAKEVTSEELTNEFIKVGRIQYYIIFLMASGLILFGKEFIITWVGNEFQTAYYVALLLIIPVCFPLIQNLGLSIMQAMNKYKFRTIIMTIMAFANIFVSIFLASKYGAIGAAIGTAVSIIICNIIIMNIYYYKVIKINVIKFWKNIIKMTLPFVFPILAIIIFMSIISLRGYLNLIVFGGIYTIMYSIICYIFVMNDYEKKIINKILKKLHLKK